MMIWTQYFRLTPILLAVFCFFSSATSSQVCAAPSEIVAKFNSLHESIEGRDDETSLPSLWSLIDQAVVDHLNSGKDVSSLRHLFSQLAGFKEPRLSRKTAINNAVFYNEPDSEPTYSVRTLEEGGSHYVLGIYTFVNRYKFKMYPGRLSLYNLRNGSWSTTGLFDGAYPILLFSFPDGLARGYVTTLERDIHADCQEGYIKNWRIHAGKLIREAEKYDQLLDFDVRTRPSSLSVSYTKYPESLCEPFLGQRIVYEIDIHLDDKNRLMVTKHSLTPWLEVWNECLLPIRFSIEKAAHCVEDKATLSKLHEVYKNECLWIDSQNGDIEKGHAYLETVSGDSMDKVWHISFNRKNSKWYISSIVEKEKGK